MDTPRRILRNQHIENVQKLSTPLRIPPSPLMKRIGYGTGVEVYKLERGAYSPWAVKKVTERFRANASQAEVFNSRVKDEAQILRKLSHPNIVGFRGITKADSNGVNTMVMECCTTSLGSILENHYEENLGPLPAAKTLRMIEDITRALDYLHTEVRLLHGDLKSFNVLVKNDFEICKLCDFGVSIQMDENGVIDFSKHPELCYVGTDHWSAPEVLDEVDVIDCKADMFSFGLVVYETIALVPPHTLDITVGEQDSELNKTENSENTDSANIDSSCATDTSSVMAKLESACGTRPPLPDVFNLSDEYNRIVEIFYLCTNTLPEDRPMARTIWQSIADTPSATTAPLATAESSNVDGSTSEIDAAVTDTDTSTTS